MSTKLSKKEKEEICNNLRSFLPPGKKIYGTVIHVSRSGMYRVIRLTITHDDEIVDISWMAAKLLQGWDNNHRGCKASGCGMDMVFALIYNLGYVLYPEGYQCIGEKCVHNSHSNRPYPFRDGSIYHSDGLGYVFRQG